MAAKIDLKVTPGEHIALKETFEHFGEEKTPEQMFYALCFCICAPQTTFNNNFKVIRALRELAYFKTHSDIDELEQVLRPTRFYRQKAKFLRLMKDDFYIIREKLAELQTSFEKREWLVKNVKGLGYKTSSHFLRNMGDVDLAIVDVHIIRFLQKTFGRCPNVATRKGYLEAEKMMVEVSKETGLSMAWLDALIWQRYSGIKWEDFKY